jgi:hypothetical protein
MISLQRDGGEGKPCLDQPVFLNKKWSPTLSQIRRTTQVMTLIVTCQGSFLIPALHIHCDTMKKGEKNGSATFE